MVFQTMPSNHRSGDNGLKRFDSRLFPRKSTGSVGKMGHDQRFHLDRNHDIVGDRGSDELKRMRAACMRRGFVLYTKQLKPAYLMNTPITF